MAERQGIELLRYSVRLFNQCDESFNQKFTASELVRIADGCQQSRWDIYPDQWEERQIQECIQFGLIPDWEEKDGKIVPNYTHPKKRTLKK